MNRNMMPILNINLEGIKVGVTQALLNHTHEIDLMINKIVEETMNEEWVYSEIKKNVTRAVRTACDRVSDDSRIVTTVHNAVVDSLLNTQKTK